MKKKINKYPEQRGARRRQRPPFRSRLPHGPAEPEHRAANANISNSNNGNNNTNDSTAEDAGAAICFERSLFSAFSPSPKCAEMRRARGRGNRSPSTAWGYPGKVQPGPGRIPGCLTPGGCVLLLVLNIWLIMRMKIKHQCYANGAAFSCGSEHLRLAFNQMNQ